MTVKDVQDDIISITNQVAPTSLYFGEFFKPQELEILPNTLPLIKIDFTGTRSKTPAEHTITHNLYIAHISYSKNENTRSNTHKEIYELIGQIDKLLLMSGQHTLIKSQKIFDNVSKGGYLTIFSLQIETTSLKDFS